MPFDAGVRDMPARAWDQSESEAEKHTAVALYSAAVERDPEA
jgi:hypothetical protein